MRGSLALVLALCLAGLQFLAVAAVVALSYLTSERVLLDHARDLLSDVGANATLHSLDFLEPASSAAQLAASLAEHRIVASEDLMQLEQLLFRQMQLHTQFAGIFYGDESGNFVHVMRSRLVPYRTKITSYNDDQRMTELIWRDRDFGIVDTQEDPLDTYDHKLRPWYKKAREEGETIWTDPYIFFTAEAPGITIAAPIADESGFINGVIGVDIEIEAISDFLADLNIGDNGVALIMNRNGDVIAHPRSDLLKSSNSDGTFSLYDISEIGDPIARRAFGKYAEMEFVSVPSETAGEFTYQGADFVSTILPAMSEKLPWTIAVYAPKADFIGEIVRNRKRGFWIAALVALATAAIGVVLANQISKPVRAFAVRSALISQGEIDPRDPVPRTYKELERANETLTREILQRKKSEREYGQTFDLASRGMAQMAPDDGRFLRVNAKFASIVGYKPEDLLKMSVKDIPTPDRPITIQQLVAEEAIDGGQSTERRCIRTDGAEIWINANAIMIHDDAGEPIHVVATIDDITESKTSEAQITKLNRDLSHYARGEVLGQMAAGLAHELSQPLTAITQNSDAAIQTVEDMGNKPVELAQILDDLDHQAHRAADIVKALRASVKKEEDWKAPFDLRQLLTQSLRLIQSEASEHKVRISVDADAVPMVLGNRVQIAQVVVNLLRNSIEALAGANVADPTIKISAQHKAGFVEVSVEDNGPGIDPELKLFTQFETTKEEGMGLGLSICRSIIHAGGGKMYHEPTQAPGARFVFTVPADDKS